MDHGKVTMSGNGRGLGATGRLLLLTAALLAVAGALCAWGVGPLAPVPAPFRLPLWAVVGVVAATESLMIRLSPRRGSASISLGEAGVVIAMYFAAPLTMVAGWTIGTTIVELVRRRSEPWRASLPTLLFTVVYLFLYGCVALLAFRALLPAGHAADPVGWLAAAGAMVVATLLGNLLVSAAIMLGGAPRDLGESLRELRLNLVTMSMTTSVALAGVTVAWFSPAAALLLLAPAAVLVLAWRTYSRERPRHDTVTLLYETIRRLQDASGTDDIVTTLAPRLLTTFQAERAEIVLLGAPDRAGAAWVIDGQGGPRPLAPAAVAPAEAVWAPVLAAGAGVLLARDPGHATRLEAAGLRDAMAAPIPAEHGPRGVVMVANAGGGLSSFLDDDLRLLETLTSHLGVALENARLVGDLRSQALHDALTGLANRSLLLERAEQALARARRDRRPFAVLLLDLDGFKRVNDSLGHAAGDQLLVTVAERIRASVRANDTPARLGGDEFAVLLDAAGDVAEAVAMGNRLLDALTVPVQLDGHGVTPAGSVGVAVWAGQATAGEVLRDADAAMYAAKRAGKRRVAVFEPHMHQAALARLEQEDALRQALDAGAMSVKYQPVVALHTGRIVAVEAIAHWPRPDGGAWPLARFESLAEEAGLIVPIGQAALEAACRQLRAWQAELGPRAPVLVDLALTRRQVLEPLLAAEVDRALAGAGLAAKHLELIVADGTHLREPAVLANLRALRDQGVRLGLGGFGSGATNLSVLRAVQVDTIKIASAHVRDLGRPGAEALLAHAVVRLCQTLDVQLVADGVDSAEQLDALRRLRCSLGQGPHLAPPVDAEAMTELLAAGPVHALARRG